jgi:hemoglobin-like flavoprotein
VLLQLGPDTDTLREILYDLAVRHVRYGVSPHYFQFMGQAIIYALSVNLGSSWDDDCKNAWIVIYEQLSGEIMKTMFNNM